MALWASIVDCLNWDALVLIGLIGTFVDTDVVLFVYVCAQERGEDVDG